MPVQDIQMFKQAAGDDYIIFNGPDEQFMSGRVIGAEGAIGGTYGVMPELYLKLDEYETDVAWLTGMLHDVGRFEQIKCYNTFNDAQSVDHANFGADLLFKEGLIDTYVDGFHDDKYGVIVENAIRNHSAFRIDERLDEYTVMFCNILRDADKVDIFRVNVDTPAEDIYNVTTEELKNSQVSPEVMAAFDERHAVLRSCKKTVVPSSK